MLPLLRAGWPGESAVETDRHLDLAAGFLIAAGVVLTLVAITHILLLWIPAHFGSAPWEFAATTQSLDVFPLAVMGSALLAVGAAVRRWRRRALVFGIVSALTSLLLIAMAVLLVLDMGVAWQSVDAQLRANVVKTGAKALGFAVVFVVYFWWLGIRLFRLGRGPRQSY